MMEKKQALIVVDDSVLVKMINGDNDEKAVQIFDMLKKAKDERVPIEAVTTMACLLKSIQDAKENVKIERLKEIITIIKVVHGEYIIDYFNNDEKRREEIIGLASFMAGNQNMNSEGG